MNRINLALVLLALAAALLVAGCGSSSDGTSGSSGGAYGGKGSAASSDTTSGGGGAATAAPASGAIVSVGSVPGLGRVLVDAKGFTLYDFHKDKGTTSSCYGGCAEVWPPLVTEGEAQTSNGAMASKLGTTQRKDGTTQVTYAGHPLYTYVEDKQPGDSRGNDFSSFGAQWYALAPSGAEAGD